MQNPAGIGLFYCCAPHFLCAAVFRLAGRWQSCYTGSGSTNFAGSGEDTYWCRRLPALHNACINEQKEGEEMPQQGVGALVLPMALAALAGYLLGSISFAVIVSRLLFHKDVREFGSGNAGMTNVLRNFGKKGAVLTLLGDILKGVFSVLIGRGLMLLLLPGVPTVYGAYAGGIAAILGHLFPLYFRFKGGKGVAVSGGVILTIQPLVAMVLLAVFLLVQRVSRMVSLGSIIGISLYAPATWLYITLTGGPARAFCTVCAVFISALVVYMHRSNMRRILDGTEYKFQQDKKHERKEEATPTETS